MDRLTFFAAVLTGLLVSCTPGDKAGYDAWDQDFVNAPRRFSQAVTALWFSSYTEDPVSHRFTRATGWGEVPEKLVPDGQGGYSLVVNLLVQGENSDGPVPDKFLTILVRVVVTDGRFSLVPNDALPGTVVGWQDQGNRTVRFRGEVKGASPSRTLWQFQGRY